MGENNESVSTGRIKILLSQHPKGLGITEISRRLGMHRNVVAKYLEILRVSGQAEMNVTGMTKVYTLSHRLPVSIISAFQETPIVVFDESGRIIQANEAFGTISGKSIDDLLGASIKGTNLPFLFDRKLDSPAGNPAHRERMIHRIFHPEHNNVQYFDIRAYPIILESGNPGTIAVGLDITREKELGEKIEQHARDLEFISQKAMGFVELPSGTDLYQAIAQDTRLMVPEAVVSVSSFDAATDSITVRSFLGDDHDVFAKYFHDMIGLTMQIPDKEIIALMASGTLHKVPGGVYICTFGQIPVFPSEKIERDLPLKCIYSIGLATNGTPLCVVTMFMNGGDTIRNPDLFVAYMRQATMALQMRHAEAKLAG